jgi:hypothetical protein
MHKERAELLINDLYAFLFQWLDGEPDVTGMEAGKMAAVMTRAAHDALTSYLDTHPVTDSEL